MHIIDLDRRIRILKAYVKVLTVLPKIGYLNYLNVYYFNEIKFVKKI